MGANVAFYGRLSADAEVKYTNSGTAVCSFSVPVKSGYGDREQTTWFRVAVFGKRAESRLTEYLTKGQGVFVTGELTAREWTDKEGNTRTSLEVNANTIDLGERPSGGSNGGSKPQLKNAKPHATRPVAEELEDDIPF